MWILFLIKQINNFFFSFFYQTDGNGGPDEVQLDAEMEKVFAGPGNRAGGGGSGDNNRQEKFNVAQLIGDAEAKDRDAQRFKDYDSDCKCFFLFLS